MLDDPIRIIVGVALLLHGLGHGGAVWALIWLQVRSQADVGGWRRARSWLVPGLPPSLAAILASVIWIVALIGFVTATLSFWDLIVPADLWRPMVLASAAMSIAGILLFLSSWPAFNTAVALAMNAAVLIAVLGFGWPAGNVHTQVIHFVPERPDLSTAVAGRCFANSLAAAGREDAWRCQTDNEIRDPCFSLGAETVVCGSDPVRAVPGFVLVLSEPLPPPDAPPAAIETARSNGWLVQLLLPGIPQGPCPARRVATKVRAPRRQGTGANVTSSSGRWSRRTPPSGSR